MTKESGDIDWSLTTWAGSRREQMRRWSKLTMDEILAAQEEMAELADELKPGATAKIREEPPADIWPPTRQRTEQFTRRGGLWRI
jgi:hypothetical protein